MLNIKWNKHFFATMNCNEIVLEITEFSCQLNQVYPILRIDEWPYAIVVTTALIKFSMVTSIWEYVTHTKQQQRSQIDNNKK